MCEHDCLTPTLEVIGMNYNWGEWDATHANYSGVPMVSSEMTRSNSARGIYDSLRQKVRKTPSWPRSWANFSLF